MKNAIVVMSFFLSLLLPGMIFCGSACAQNVVYSETFASGTAYFSGSPQYDNWASFRAQLATSTHTFTRATTSGSNNPVGVSCTDPVIVTQMADALRNGTPGSWTCDSRTWVVDTGCGQTSAVEFNATGSTCQCDAPGYIVRPHILNENWGGISTATCDAPTQTMRVTFEEKGVTAVPIMSFPGMIVFVVLAGLGAFLLLMRRKNTI
jgi:hypothetical protein